MSDQLNILASLISDGIADVNRIYKETGKPYPALDDPNAPPHISGNTQLQAATNIVLAAAAQLIDRLVNYVKRTVVRLTIFDRLLVCVNLQMLSWILSIRYVEKLGSLISY